MFDRKISSTQDYKLPKSLQGKESELHVKIERALGALGRNDDSKYFVGCHFNAPIIYGSVSTMIGIFKIATVILQHYSNREAARSLARENWQTTTLMSSETSCSTYFKNQSLMTLDAAKYANLGDMSKYIFNYLIVEGCVDRTQEYNLLPADLQPCKNIMESFEQIDFNFVRNLTISLGFAAFFMVTLFTIFNARSSVLNELGPSAKNNKEKLGEYLPLCDYKSVKSLCRELEIPFSKTMSVKDLYRSLNAVNSVLNEQIDRSRNLSNNNLNYQH